MLNTHAFKFRLKTITVLLPLVSYFLTGVHKGTVHKHWHKLLHFNLCLPSGQYVDRMNVNSLHISSSYVDLDSYGTFWSSKGRSFVMRSLNPCPENFAQNLVERVIY